MHVRLPVGNLTGKRAVRIGDRARTMAEEPPKHTSTSPEQSSSTSSLQKPSDDAVTKVPQVRNFPSSDKILIITRSSIVRCRDFGSKRVLFFFNMIKLQIWWKLSSNLGEVAICNYWRCLGFVDSKSNNLWAAFRCSKELVGEKKRSVDRIEKDWIAVTILIKFEFQKYSPYRSPCWYSSSLCCHWHIVSALEVIATTKLHKKHSPECAFRLLEENTCCVSRSN